MANKDEDDIKNNYDDDEQIMVKINDAAKHAIHDGEFDEKKSNDDGNND